MDSLTKNVELSIPTCLYLKNPRESKTGGHIISEAAAMIATGGIEQLTFKKLALRCGCTEATVYRYFENKHSLLLYVLNIFWIWQEYRMVLATQNIEDPMERLDHAIAVIARPEIPKDQGEFGEHVLLTAIHEGVKIHLSRELRKEIDNGSMSAYHRLVQRLGALIRNYLPDYLFSEALSVTLLDNALQQLFFMKHFSGMAGKIQSHNSLEKYLKSLIPQKS